MGRGHQDEEVPVWGAWEQGFRSLCGWAGSTHGGVKHLSCSTVVPMLHTLYCNQTHPDSFTCQPANVSTRSPPITTQEHRTAGQHL